MAADIEFVDDGQTVLIRFPKGKLAMSRAEFAKHLRRGKRFKRRESFEARMTPVPYAEFHQEPQAVDHASLAVVGRESVAEQEAPVATSTEVDHSAKEYEVTPLIMEHGIADVSVAARELRQQVASAAAAQPTRNFRQRGRASRQDIMNAVQKRVGRPDLPW